MSFAGQVDCQRMLIGPCALTTAGNPRVAAPAVAAAPARKRRRVVSAGFFTCSLLMEDAPSVEIMDVAGRLPRTMRNSRNGTGIPRFGRCCGAVRFLPPAIKL